MKRGVDIGRNNLPLSGLLSVILSSLLVGKIPSLVVLLLASVCDFAAFFLSASES